MRYRHTDSDLYRNARQQLFLDALKDRLASSFHLQDIPGLVGAIRTCMGSVGARTIRELQQTELIIAPTIKTEGKVFQQAQKLGRPR